MNLGKARAQFLEALRPEFSFELQFSSRAVEEDFLLFCRSGQAKGAKTFGQEPLEDRELKLVFIQGLHCTEEANLLLTQQPRIRFSAFTKIYFDVAEIYRWHQLEESGQWLENVERTHLVLASGQWQASAAKESVFNFRNLGETHF